MSSTGLKLFRTTLQVGATRYFHVNERHMLWVKLEVVTHFNNVFGRNFTRPVCCLYMTSSDLTKLQQRYTPRSTVTVVHKTNITTSARNSAHQTCKLPRYMFAVCSSRQWLPLPTNLQVLPVVSIYACTLRCAFGFVCLHVCGKRKSECAQRVRQSTLRLIDHVCVRVCVWKQK